MMKMPAKKILFFTAWILMLTVSASQQVMADIYMYVDANGVYHFTNAPTSSKYRLYINERSHLISPGRSTNKYDKIITKASQYHGVSFPLIKAIIKAESNFNPQAVSKKGAMGLMQLMPENVDLLNIKDPFDPVENIMGGAKYFRKLLDRFEGELRLSLAAYNAGPEAVQRYNQIPPYRETEEYIRRVLNYYRTYKN